MRSADAAAAPADASVLLRWLTARDAVLRGLVHTLSNRVGTVVAASGMLLVGSADVAGRVLEGEADRLDALLAEFRLVTADPFEPGTAPEPVVLGEVVAQAIALRTHVGEARDAVVTLEGVSEVPPVLASPARLLQALVVLLDGVDAAAITLRARDNDRGGVELSTEPAPSADVIATAAWLLGGAGGRGIVLPRFGTLPDAGG